MKLPENSPIQPNEFQFTHYTPSYSEQHVSDSVTQLMQSIINQTTIQNPRKSHTYQKSEGTGSKLGNLISKIVNYISKQFKLLMNKLTSSPSKDENLSKTLKSPSYTTENRGDLADQGSAIQPKEEKALIEPEKVTAPSQEQADLLIKLTDEQNKLAGRSNSPKTNRPEYSIYENLIARLKNGEKLTQRDVLQAFIFDLRPALQEKPKVKEMNETELEQLQDLIVQQNDKKEGSPRYQQLGAQIEDILKEEEQKEVQTPPEKRKVRWAENEKLPEENKL